MMEYLTPKDFRAFLEESASFVTKSEIRYSKSPKIKRSHLNLVIHSAFNDKQRIFSPSGQSTNMLERFLMWVGVDYEVTRGLYGWTIKVKHE